MIKLLPTLLPFVNISLDSQILQSAIDKNASPETYWRKAIGNEGELDVLKILTDPLGADKLDISEIKTQHSDNNKSGRPIKPDFYVPNKNMIGEAKAWRSIVESRGDVSKLNDIVKKYADYLNEDGEVRLYFPKDVYENLLEQKKLEPDDAILNKIVSSYNSVKITVEPMMVTHKEILALERMHRNLYKYYLG